jgi:hypothetical protein
MEDGRRLRGFIVDERLNAVAAWLLVGLVCVVAVASFLEGDLLWTWFSAVVVAIVVVPAVSYRNPRVMLPWEVLAIAFLPVLGRTLASFPLSSDLATYLSVAALALVVAVELDVFTAVRMTDGFAAFFTVVVTMAAAGVWAVVQWLSDLLLGTTFIYPDPVLVPDAAVQQGVVGKAYWLSDLLFGTTFVGQEPVIVSTAAEQAALDALMWDFVAATLAGVVAGGIFVLYFWRRRDATIHLPEDGTQDVEEGAT